jgi:two-component system sensor histidine kinase/response regulator
MQQKQQLILVAEDDATLRFVVKRQLTSLGYIAHLVENGAAAVERATKTNYALILMDVQMPVMDGLEATVAIRAAELQRHAAQTPVIAMTANPHKEQCFQAGMNDFLFKPVMLNQLEAALKRWLPDH